MEIKKGHVYLSRNEQNRTGYPSPMPFNTEMLGERFQECRADFAEYNEEMSAMDTELTLSQRAVLPKMGERVIERERFLNNVVKKMFEDEVKGFAA